MVLAPRSQPLHDLLTQKSAHHLDKLDLFLFFGSSITLWNHLVVNIKGSALCALQALVRAL